MNVTRYVLSGCTVTDRSAKEHTRNETNQSRAGEQDSADRLLTGQVADVVTGGRVSTRENDVTGQP
jgi:hypothetical protein